MVLGLLAGVFEITYLTILGYSSGNYCGFRFSIEIYLDNNNNAVSPTNGGQYFYPKIMGAQGAYPVYIIIVLWFGGFFGVLDALCSPSDFNIKNYIQNIYISIVLIAWTKNARDIDKFADFLYNSLYMKIWKIR